MHFNMKSTLVLLYLLGISIKAIVRAQNDPDQSQCDNENLNSNEIEQCQRVCKCECDEYWEEDDLCLSACASSDNDPLKNLAWCANFDLADDCDIYGSNWKDSTIKSELDIPYMQAYGREFKLNFFSDTARGTEELLPLAIIIHGGGFNSGSKSNCKIIESAREFAARGFRAIAINYPKCGAYWNGTNIDQEVPLFGTSEDGWHAWNANTPLYPLYSRQQHPQCNGGGAASNIHPEQYAQAAEVVNRAARYAIQYAHSQKDTWGINVDTTVCHGASAGAISCTELFLFNTTVQYKPTVTGFPLEPELDKIKINVNAGRAGGLMQTRAITQDSIDTMAPGAAVYDLHGDQDDVVNISAAINLIEEMEKFGIPAELDVAEGEGHSMFQYQFLENPEKLDYMFEFIERYIVRHPSDNFVYDVVDGDDGGYDGGILSCFSSSVNAIVKGRGKVPMNEIMVGDQVLTGNGNFETIYTIDHRHLTKDTKFLHITYKYGMGRNNKQLSIELTENHMIFVDHKPNPVPANTVKVGDRVLTVDGSYPITEITIVTRKGVFNPLTTDGTIIADGVISSTYSVLASNSDSIKINDKKFISYQSFFKNILKPYTRLCTTISLDICKTQKEKVFLSDVASKIFFSLQNKSHQTLLLFSSFTFVYMLNMLTVGLVPSILGWIFIKHKK